uniref:Uncharacterized protein n=1 Tax=Parascaris equorum TaxID=6256 RepID=A0A914S231_PAREQ
MKTISLGDDSIINRCKEVIPTPIVSCMRTQWLDL